MERIRFVCRGLIAFAILVAILMAKPTSSHGRTYKSSRVTIEPMKQQEGDQELITAVSKFDVPSNLKKGNTHSRLTDLKRFLATFGYLDQDGTPPTALFDYHLEAALRLYQRSFNLSATGILDRATLDSLRVPRCGREDVRDGLALMLIPQLEERLSRQNGSWFPTLLEARLWKHKGRKRMWRTTRNLTYAFSNLPKSAILSSNDIRSGVASAFRSWAAVVPIDFQATDDFEGANIKIEFLAEDHGDGLPFDGPLGKVAHAFAPEDGRFHFDRAEVWTVSMAITGDSSAVDIETVALHEIGHLIGLDHSMVHSSVMFPHLETRKINRQLTDNDIQEATALYGPRTSEQDYEIPHHGPPGGDFKKHAGYQRVSNYERTLVFLAGFAFASITAWLINPCFWILHLIRAWYMDKRNAARPVKAENKRRTFLSN